MLVPIIINDNLPAAKILKSENVFFMREHQAYHQDIRPLRIAILNLMPTKIETETELLRLLGNTPLQLEITLLQTASHVSKNTSAEHLLTFYNTYDEVKDTYFDGLIITGAPVEQLPFETVDYWEELCKVMEWSKSHVYSTFHICWGAQAALYYHYGVPKYLMAQKLTGIYMHRPLFPLNPLLRGFDDIFYVPHSRYTEVRVSDIKRTGKLNILSYSEDAGVHIVADKTNRQIFLTGHSEYSRNTLRTEYNRDVNKGLNPHIPNNYFEDNDPSYPPVMLWKSHANLLFSNWINHIVYQYTPYEIGDINKIPLEI